jgi:hypothetical protein
MAFQLKRTFELIDPSTFDAAAALCKAAVSYYIDLTFDGDDDDVEEDIWLARRPAAADPDNHPAVLVHAFTKFCDSSRDFAYVLHLLTGWPMMAVGIQTDDTGSSEISFVRNPDGRLLDASGWVDEPAVLARGDVLINGFSPVIVKPLPGSPLDDFDEETGCEKRLKEIADVIRAFPHSPFREPWFRAMTFRKLAGVDQPPVLIPHGEKLTEVANEWLAMAGDNECCRASLRSMASTSKTFN